ncbi:EamA family transporter RarD [Arsenicitalea aurantiaca]|uniref:EamA family transporter RarD n=1 Tax=Arsenicitalea aurantiaca TaxID=1783274 RepID=A0A433XM68_9HYPH|nr:EamA family transporter RarD [Arsenicitalea aurantiaca]RUT35104.1 EamA family transporter RarD [Arsenicitalea aurantiaca]
MSLPELDPHSRPDVGARVARTPEQEEQRAGLIAALFSYLLWGFLPLFFALLEGVDTITIVANRTLWTLVLVGAILLVARRMHEVKIVFSSRRTMAVMTLTALLLAFNWSLYIYGVESGNVLETSFGYFINPLINVALGMVLLGEKQNRLQLVAIGVAVIAIGIQAAGIGGIPYIALGLAFSFGLYGYVRKTASVNATTGLFVDTALMVPLALAYLAYSVLTVGWGPHADPYTMGLLLLTGPVTAVPLLLFSYGVRRLRMTTIGMLQYLAPSLQFMLAITYFGEDLNALRLLSFGLIWLSLAIFTFDTVLRHRRKGAEA